MLKYVLAKPRFQLGDSSTTDNYHHFSQADDTLSTSSYGNVYEESIETLEEKLEKQAMELARQQYELGERFRRGEEDYPKSEVKAFEWYLKSGRQNFGPAQYAVGLMYLDGKGVEQSQKKAFQWFRKAAERDVIGAQYNLGKCLEERCKIDEAIKWYKKAEGQCTSSQYRLGVIYSELNQSCAPHYFFKAAEKDFPEAQLGLARLYYQGGLLPRSLEKSHEWALKAANNDLPAAQYEVAMNYWEGEGVEESKEDALLWLLSAAENENVDAQEFLLVMHYEKLPLVRSFERSIIEWGVQSLTKERLHSISTFIFAKMYETGCNVIVKDYQKAFDLYSELVASCICPKHLENESLYSMAIMVLQNKIERPVWSIQVYLVDAAETNHTESQYLLGVIEFFIQIMTNPYSTTIPEWISKTVRKEHELSIIFKKWAIQIRTIMVYTDEMVSDSLINDFFDLFTNPEKREKLTDIAEKIGALYFDAGHKEQAFYWYNVSAQAGNIKSQYNIGAMYGSGIGVDQSLEKGYDWHDRTLRNLLLQMSSDETYSKQVLNIKKEMSIGKVLMRERHEL